MKVPRDALQCQWFPSSTDRVSRRGRQLLLTSLLSQSFPRLRTKPGSLSTTSSASRKVLLLPSLDQRTSPDPELSSPASPNSPGSHSEICPGKVWLGRHSFQGEYAHYQCLPQCLLFISPRESVTFEELQKTMPDSDKNLMDDDDTDSFEALERRLRTCRK